MKEKQHTLLIVDDSSIIRKAIIKFLEDFDIEIIGTASNSDSALEIFKEKRPDLVTLDITLPGLDGFHVMKEMINFNQATKIIVITALADSETGLKSIRLGACSYLAKPFGPKKLQETIQKVLEKN